MDLFEHAAQYPQRAGYRDTDTSKAAASSINPDIHTLRIHWVRGHDGHQENERCDELATAAAADQPTAVDSGYEAPQTPP